jgi:simple sugar transport system permease protein
MSDVATAQRTAGRRERRGFPVSVRLHDPSAVPGVVLRSVLIVVGVSLGLAVMAWVTGIGTSIFSVMWRSTFGSAVGISSVMQASTSLILAACAVAIGRQVGLWNIGVDGQLYFGAWSGALITFHVSSAPSVVMIVLCLIFSFLGGALFALIPALLRVYLGVSEILTTLMFSFLGPLWVTYWATGPWTTGNNQSIETKPVPEKSWLPQLQLGEVTIGVGLLIAIAVCIVVWAVFRYSETGFRARLIGGDETTARYAGISVERSQLLVFLVSGGVAGLAGGTLMLDQIHTVSLGLSSNTGFLAVVVAVLALNSAMVCIPMGIVLGAMVTATLGLQIAGVSPDATLLLFGVLIFVGGLADVVARYRIERRRSTPPTPTEPPAQDATAVGSPLEVSR